MVLGQAERTYHDWSKSFNRSFNAKQGNCVPLLGIIQLDMGHEDNSHIRMEYKVKLIDYPEQPTIVCKRLMPQASFDGVGQYYPLEDGDPVIILAKEGNLEDGLIIGSPYIVGNYEEYSVKGKAINPTKLTPQSVDPYNSNQPYIHPDRIAEPDAFFWVIGGKKTNNTFNDPSFHYTKESKAANRPQPVSIEIRNKHGDYAIWCSGDHITYTDKDVIVVSNADGKSACQRHQETASYYMGIVKTMKQAFGLTDTKSEEVEEINTGEDIVSLMTGASKKVSEDLIDTPITSQIATATMQTVNESLQGEPDSILSQLTGATNQVAQQLIEDVNNPEIEESDTQKENSILERTIPYINGLYNPSHLQYAKSPHYQINELMKAARRSQRLAQSCNEKSMVTNVSNKKAMNVLSPISSSSCAMGDKECNEIPNEFKLNEEDTKRLQAIEGEMLVAIDPGHGGSDPGAIGYQGLKEKEVVLDISLKLSKALNGKGIKTVLTRESDTEPSLANRVNIAEKAKAKLFISIHNNASFSKNASGINTYYYNSSDKYSQISSSLATLVQSSLTTNISELKDRGVKQANFYVIKRNPIPSVLLELGFIDMKTDGSLLASTEFRQKTANILAEALSQHIS